MGFGRMLTVLNSATIVVLTDGMSLLDAPQGKLSIAEPGAPGFYSSPFRWDQRVFGVVLRLPRFEAADRVGDALDTPDGQLTKDVCLAPLATVCEETGGTCCIVSSLAKLQSQVCAIVCAIACACE
jgi:hypothetical protein